MEFIRRCGKTTSCRHERGQAMTELALTLVILLLILSGIVDFGRAFFTYLALHNAAGEGAYYASAFPLRVDSSDSPDPDNIAYRTRNEVPGSLGQLVDWSTTTINVTYSDSSIPPRVGTYVTVAVESPFHLIGPLPGLFGWDGEITLRTNATQTILTNRED